MSLQQTQSHDDVAIREVERKQRGRFRLPALGILQAMKVTLRQMLSRAVTVHYPEERVELPPRSRGVIALLEENCTVCMLCAKECPCWCIYIEGHKVQKEGRRKPVNELDRFAIDFGLCMYCGICVEVCPFDALHWSPAFEYTAYTYEGLIHEVPVLTNWEHHVLPPPQLVEDAEEKARSSADTANEKRTQGIAAVIREKDKADAYRAREAAASTQHVDTSPPPAPPAVGTGAGPTSPGSTVPPGPAVPVQSTPAPTGAQTPAPVPPGSSSDTPASAQTAEQQAPAAGPPPSPADAASPSMVDREPSATEAVAPAGEVQTFGLPRVDPMSLPDGIGPVERGRLKKLAILQERGQEPPDDLVQNLKPILDEMGGG